MVGQAWGPPFPPTLVSGGEPVPPRGAGGADGGGQGAWHLSLPRPPSLWSRGGPGRGVLLPAAGQAWGGLSADPTDRGRGRPRPSQVQGLRGRARGHGRSLPPGGARQPTAAPRPLVTAGRSQGGVGKTQPQLPGLEPKGIPPPG